MRGQNGGPGLEEILDNELVGEYFGKRCLVFEKRRWDDDFYFYFKRMASQ